MLRALRIIGLIEGTSFLVLLLIAMPLKRIWGYPEAVTIMGAAHGGLFLLYLSLGFFVGVTHKWPINRIATMVIAATIPLGTFVFDGSLRREEAVKSDTYEARE